MKRFLLIYYTPNAIKDQSANASNEDAQKGMQLWSNWAGNVDDQLVDLGMPLGNAKKVTAEGVSEGESQVSGYTLLDAESMEEALALTANHPHLMVSGGYVEVHEGQLIPEVT